MKQIIVVIGILISLFIFIERVAKADTVNSIQRLEQKNNNIKKEIERLYFKNYEITKYKEAFEQSQIEWIQYRDRYCKDYIGFEASTVQGSGAELIVLECLVNQNNNRLIELSKLIK